MTREGIYKYKPLTCLALSDQFFLENGLQASSTQDQEWQQRRRDKKPFGLHQDGGGEAIAQLE